MEGPGQAHILPSAYSVAHSAKDFHVLPQPHSNGPYVAQTVYMPYARNQQINSQDPSTPSIVPLFTESATQMDLFTLKTLCNNNTIIYNTENAADCYTLLIDIR